MNHLKLKTTSTSSIDFYIADVIRVIKIIPIRNLKKKQIFRLDWKNCHLLKIFAGWNCPCNSDETDLHYVFKGKNEKFQERDMTNVNRSLPKPIDWQDVLTNSKTKQKLTYLLSYHLQLRNTANKIIYVTKGRHRFPK